jgi:hypothetical protein
MLGGGKEQTYPMRMSMAWFLCLSSFILSCSGFPYRKDSLPPNPTPQCQNNFRKEWSLTLGSIQKTWARYEKLDSKRALDIAFLTLQHYGYKITSVDNQAGIIHAEMTIAAHPQAPYPLQVTIDREDSSSIVYLSIKETGGAIDSSISCGFYESFEGTLAKAPASPQRMPVAPSAPKPQEIEKQISASVESIPKPVSPPNSSKPSFAPTPPQKKPGMEKSASSGNVPAKTATVSFSGPSSPPSKITQVVWNTVNLREGPGSDFRVVGVTKKGKSYSVLEDKGGWLRVRIEGEKEAWIVKGATTEAPKETLHPTALVSPPVAAPKPAPLKLKSPM